MTWQPASRWSGPQNAAGVLATATAGNLPTWALALTEHGRLALADVIGPAIRHAERGFIVTDYLSECTAEAAPDLARDPTIASLFLPGGEPVKRGAKLVQADYAETLKAIARDGAAALHGGAVGRRVADFMARSGGISPWPISQTTGRSCASRCAAPSATRPLSDRRRQPQAACTSSRCSISSKATISQGWALPASTRSMPWPRRSRSPLSTATRQPAIQPFSMCPSPGSWTRLTQPSGALKSIRACPAWQAGVTPA